MNLNDTNGTQHDDACGRVGSVPKTQELFRGRVEITVFMQLWIVLDTGGVLRCRCRGTNQQHRVARVRARLHSRNAHHLLRGSALRHPTLRDRFTQSEDHLGVGHLPGKFRYNPSC